MEAHICNHPKVSHTVQYCLTGGSSVGRDFPDLELADIFAQKILRQNPKRLSWLKVFRSDNEIFTCFRWDNPNKEYMTVADAEEMKVKLEVDMEPLKVAFDNVATGFKEQGKDIRKTQALLAFLSFLIMLNFLMDILA